MQTEATTRADFTRLRYAQCWEDADVLLAALDVQPGDVCLSIASAGDNCLALLTRRPARVVAIDFSPAQLACLELRVAAYRVLDHAQLLELIGSRPSSRRHELYAACRGLLTAGARQFWDARSQDVANGIGTAGKFEHYFRVFRDRILPLIHSRRVVNRLLQMPEATEREQFYEKRWNTWRWQLLFRLFFSRFVMGRMGRDPEFFRYVTGSVSDRILRRGRYALTTLNPADNPYLQWILAGRHVSVLPCALRPENFEIIRNNLDRLEWRETSLEAYLEQLSPQVFDCFNLSDIFEYMSADNFHSLLDRLVRAGRPGARLVYWNTLADRRRPEFMADRLRSLTELSQGLHARDRAFFYCALVIEEII